MTASLRVKRFKSKVRASIAGFFAFTYGSSGFEQPFYFPHIPAGIGPAQFHRFTRNRYPLADLLFPSQGPI